MHVAQQAHAGVLQWMLQYARPVAIACSPAVVARACMQWWTPWHAMQLPAEVKFPLLLTAEHVVQCLTACRVMSTQSCSIVL